MKSWFYRVTSILWVKRAICNAFQCNDYGNFNVFHFVFSVAAWLGKYNDKIWFTISDTIIHIVWHITIEIVPFFAAISRPNVIQYVYKFLITNKFVLSKAFVFFYLKNEKKRYVDVRSIDAIWCAVTDAHNSNWYRCFPIRFIHFYGFIHFRVHANWLISCRFSVVELSLLFLVFVFSINAKWGLNYTFRLLCYSETHS